MLELYQVRIEIYLIARFAVLGRTSTTFYAIYSKQMNVMLWNLVNQSFPKCCLKCFTCDHTNILVGLVFTEILY